MATSITTRAGKGSRLTHAEVDANFTNLRGTADAALEAGEDALDLAEDAQDAADAAQGTANTALGVAEAALPASSAVPVTAVLDAPTVFDEVLVRDNAAGGALKTAFIGDLPFGSGGGGGDAADPMNLWDFWYFSRIGNNNVAANDMFLGTAVSSGTNSTALPTTGMAGFNSHGVFLRSSTTANGGFRYQTSSLVADYFGTISHKFRCQYMPLTAFTNVTVRPGYHDTSTSADATDGAYFEIVGATCSAKTANNSTRTTNATTVTLSLNTAYTFDIDVNAAGTEARFRVYAGNSPTPIMDVTNTTNIPTSSARAFGAGIVATESTTTAVDIGILYGLGVGTIEGFARVNGVLQLVPGAFTDGQWTATAGDGSIEYNITALPSAGSGAITALQYRHGSGSAVNFSGTGTGIRTVSGLTNAVAVDSQIRAVNEFGPGLWSDTKTRTPVAASSGDLTFVKASAVRAGDFGSDATLTFPSDVTAGNHVLAMFYTDSQSRNFSGTGATLDGTEDQSTAFRAQGLRTNSIGANEDVFAYALSSGWNFSGGAIEVSGSAPVFDDSFGGFDASGTGAERELPITVAEDNSIVLLVLAPQDNRTWTWGGTLTGISNSGFCPMAWVKLNAGSHTLRFTPDNSITLNGFAAFVWSPGA